jgi:DNA-binding transcriptional LysR family regulator
MSTALRRLRDFFDDQLLVPIGRQIVFTPLAESLVGPVQDIILQVKALIDYTPGFDARTAARQFTVMASDYTATVFLSTLLRYLKDAAPGVSLDIVSVEDQLHGPLERGEVDILIQPEQFLSPDHPAERLFEDEYVCIVWEGNSKFTDRISFDQYMNAHHVVTRYGKTRMLTLDGLYFRDLERQRTIDVVAMNFTLIPHFVHETERVATLHSRLAKLFSRLYPLRILPVPSRSRASSRACNGIAITISIPPRSGCGNVWFSMPATSVRPRAFQVPTDHRDQRWDSSDQTPWVARGPWLDCPRQEPEL